MAPLGDERSSVPATNTLAQMPSHIRNHILPMGVMLVVVVVVVLRRSPMAESSTPIIIGPHRSRQQWHTEEQ